MADVCEPQAFAAHTMIYLEMARDAAHGAATGRLRVAFGPPPRNGEAVVGHFGAKCFRSGKVISYFICAVFRLTRISSATRLLRGQLGNGLCLCLLHDKAFELGLFTLDREFRVFVNPKEVGAHSTIAQNLYLCVGQRISVATIAPLADALREHWIRLKLNPQGFAGVG